MEISTNKYRIIVVFLSFISGFIVHSTSFATPVLISSERDILSRVVDYNSGTSSEVVNDSLIVGGVITQDLSGTKEFGSTWRSSSSALQSDLIFSDSTISLSGSSAYLLESASSYFSTGTQGRSMAEILFQLKSDMYYDFSGEVLTSAVTPSIQAYSQAFVSFLRTDSSGSFYSDISVNNVTSINNGLLFLDTGILSAGYYSIRTLANTFAGPKGNYSDASASFDFTLYLNDVPFDSVPVTVSEPSLLSLFFLEGF